MKKATGIIRRIDDLGRIVIPKEIRHSLNLGIAEPLEIILTDDGILLKQYKIEPENITSVAEEWLHDYKNLIENYDSKFNIDGNITTCEIIKSGRRKTGKAICNPSDAFSPAVGMVLSFCRAINIKTPFDDFN